MRILADLNYVEQTGHGMPDVVDIYGRNAFELHNEYINVTLPFDKDVLRSHRNLILNKNVNVGINVGIDVGIKLNNTQQNVYDLIVANPSITYIELAKKLNKSEETIRRSIKTLVEFKLIERQGSRKIGSWKISKER